MKYLKSLPAKAVAVAGLVWATGLAPVPSVLIAPASAVIGRPLTPVSYAGVARRTTRRVVATSAAVAATPTTVVVAAPVPAGCVQVVDSYGRVTYRCP